MIQSLLNPAKIKGSDIQYRHLTLKERYQIHAYRHTKTQKEIAMPTSKWFSKFRKKDTIGFKKGL